METASKSYPAPALARRLGAAWAIVGFIVFLSYAIARLFSVSLDAWQYEFSLAQWSLLIANCIFMAYSEGYKGFQKAYAPRLAARAKYLLREGSWRQLGLAPLFCMCFFDAPRKRIIVSYALLVMIVVLVTLFRLLPQPWRGILDAGVVIGLTWGLISTVWFCIAYFGASNAETADPEVRLVDHRQ